MRLVNADTLPVHKAYCVDEAGWGANFYVVDKSDIDNAPTIDAVPVVRCEDCEYYEAGECVCPWMVKSDFAHFYPLPDFFCAYGERRSE